MAIVSCEHHTGMGLCSACAAEMRESVDRERLAVRKRMKAEKLVRELEARGEHETARRIREKEGL